VQERDINIESRKSTAAAHQIQMWRIYEETNMSDKSKITWNPVTGCTKISAGCANCYAEQMATRLQRMQPDGRYRNGFAVTCHEDVLEIPLRWKRGRRIFVNSMSDLFHEDVPLEFIDKVFSVMALSPQHTYQILTKRPERMREYLEEIPCGTWAHHARRDICKDIELPLPNVWIGVTAENQHEANRRIPLLLQTPAAKRFVSIEPILGPIDFNYVYLDENFCPSCREFSSENEVSKHYCDSCGEIDSFADSDVCNKCGEGYEDYEYSVCPRCGYYTATGYPYGSAGSTIYEIIAGAAIAKLDWVIVGGESGPHARPMNPDWVRSIRDQCKAADVPFMFKQWGKSENGHLLDGAEHMEFPRGDSE
jgi:protein gp37